MTSISSLFRRRTCRVVAIRCAACQLWRKPRYYTGKSVTCRTCTRRG